MNYGYIDKPKIAVGTSYASVNNKIVYVCVDGVALSGDWPKSFNLREIAKEIEDAVNEIFINHSKKEEK